MKARQGLRRADEDLLAVGGYWTLLDYRLIAALGYSAIPRVCILKLRTALRTKKGFNLKRPEASSQKESTNKGQGENGSKEGRSKSRIQPASQQPSDLHQSPQRHFSCEAPSAATEQQ